MHGHNEEHDDGSKRETDGGGDESNAPGEGRAMHFGPLGSGTIEDGGTDSRQHTSASELLAICRPGALDQAQVRTKGASRAR